MLSVITLSVLIAVKSVYVLGAPSNAKGISIPLQEPSSPLARDGVIIPDALAHEAPWIANKVAAAAAMIKNTEPANSSRALSRRRNVPLGRLPRGLLRTAQIEIGTPPQQFRAVIDTYVTKADYLTKKGTKIQPDLRSTSGSPVTWVLSSACKAPEYSDKNKYDPSQSTSKVQQSSIFRTQYVGGSQVSGLVYADTVTIAGLSAERQVFSAVDQINLVGSQIEGLLGLALKRDPELNAPTLIDTLFSQHKIPARIFSIYLSSTSGSELFIGGINSSKYTGRIVYAPTVLETSWIVEGSVNVNNQESLSGKMAIDSGASLIFGSRDSVEKFWSKVPGSEPCSEDDCRDTGYFKFPCANAPSISFRFNGHEFPITQRDCSIGTTRSNPLFCVGSIRIHGLPDDIWFLGASFMKSVYTIFDVTESRIGFATPVPQSPPGSISTAFPGPSARTLTRILPQIPSSASETNKVAQPTRSGEQQSHGTSSPPISTQQKRPGFASREYYRVYEGDYAYPHECMIRFISKIPRNPEKLEDWIENTGKALEDKNQWPSLFSAAVDDVQVLNAADSSWILGEIYVMWNYIIDLDNRVFTVNGGVHFRLENMPHTNGLCSLLMGFKKVDIPTRFIKPVDLWPPARFDTAQAEQIYSHQLQPLVIALPEWGAPTWDTLTVAQALSASLVETLVDDYTDELALTQFSSVWHKVGLFCWQVANAAAPCHLTCPPFDAMPNPSSIYMRASLIKFPTSTDPSITHYMGGAGTIGRYCWFRGCLITFCPRLDEPVYMMHQVGQMAQNLRKHGRTTEIGIIMSGWHVVAVAVDGPKVRHSPVLDLHDGKKLKDGFLLLTHLLAPAVIVSKAPWRNEPSAHHSKSDWILPEEIIEHIIHFVDWDTYSALPTLSQSFRSICLAYPRVGEYILLGYETTATSGPVCKGPVFKIRRTDSTSSRLARLARFAKCVYNRLPLWKFRAKCYWPCILQPGFAGTFQHLQVGTGPGVEVGPRELPEYNLPPFPPLPSHLLAAFGLSNWNGRTRVFFQDVIRGDQPEMRIQALDGLWSMVPVGRREENACLNPGQCEPLGIDAGERLGGFDREDLKALSEVESDGWWLDDGIW